MATATRTSLDELTEFVELAYGVPRLQTRILISTYLPTNYPPLWIMVDSEMCRFLEDLSYAVTKFEHSAILDTWYLREQRAWLNRKYAMILVSAREKPQIFANRYWDWPGPHIFPRFGYHLVAQECLRLRLEFDASKQPGSLAKDGLYELMKRALTEAKVDRGGVVPRQFDNTFYRRASLLPLIDQYLTNRTTLMRNLEFVAANHAAICGRSELNEEDLSVQRMMLRHAVPIWAEKILRVVINRGSRAIGWREIVNQTGQAFEWQWRYGGVHVSRPPKVGERIVRDFFESGLIERTKNNR